MSVLKSKVAFITGAAGGIGQAIAVEYAKQGASVAVADIASGEATVAAIQRAGGTAMAVSCDVSREDSVNAAVAAVKKAYGTIDVLVNVAGLVPKAWPAVDEMTADLWDRTFGVNIRGMFLCVKAVVPIMKSAKRGKILNISSATTFLGLPNACAYVASKSAVIGFSRSIARELGASNIQVNVITPGLIPTTPGVSASGL
ncbi:MAG: SDR family NAD(P)-dependent oxidoreductase, partial [Steroidobacteraceae bacterium]